MKKTLSQFGQKPLIRKEAGSLVQQEQIKSQITIFPEFESLIPPLTNDEYEQLEANIIRDGCREPLLVWNTTQHVLYENSDSTTVYVLIDGHNRYGICQRNGLDFKISLREFDEKEAVRSFMIDNQLGRRNLSPEQMAYLRGQKYLSIKKKPGRPNQPPTDTHKRRTEDALAEQFNVSPKTIRLDAQYAKGLDKLSDTLKKDVLTRKVKVKKSDLIALGDLERPIQPIESPAELGLALAHTSKQFTHNNQIDDLATNRLSPYVSERIDNVVILAQRLKEPTASIRDVSIELIESIKNLITYLDNSATTDSSV